MAHPDTNDGGNDRAAEAARSSYGTVPGAEFPTIVYLSVFAAFAWVILASWVAFAGDGDADLALSFVLVLSVVFFALPVLIYLTARHRAAHTGAGKKLLSEPVETATGILSGASAFVQVLLIPSALALAATLIGGVAVLAH